MHINKKRKAVILVLDSLGCGIMSVHPEEDEGANTLGNVAWWYLMKHGKPIPLPNLQKLGLANLAHVPGLDAVKNPLGAYGIATLDPIGMTDTITGHWAMVGLETGLFPASRGPLPQDIIQYLEDQIDDITGNRIKFLGDGKNISGTEILKTVGKDAESSYRPIIYTSSDSVIQIAYWVGFTAKNIGINTRPFALKFEPIEGFKVSHQLVNGLYSLCELIRRILDTSDNPNHKYLRVIARPFVTAQANPLQYQRVSALRKDFVLPTPGVTILDNAKKKGLIVGSVGKIWDMFSGKGISESETYPPRKEHRHLRDDAEGIQFTLESLGHDYEGILFVNLVELDEKFGHRNDPDGYAEALIKIDQALPQILSALGDDDILFITGDHGNDPTRSRTKWYTEHCGLEPKFYDEKGTNHTREFVPVLVYGKRIKPVDLKTIYLADIGDTITQMFSLPTRTMPGRSLLCKLGY